MSAPPLPQPMSLPFASSTTTDDPDGSPAIRLYSVKAGAWLVNYEPVNSRLVAYDGTIRVEVHSAGRTASGDLYQRPVTTLRRSDGRTTPIMLPPPAPGAGIPIQSRTQYRYYLRITRILEGSTTKRSFSLGFQMWRFTKAGISGTWNNEGDVTAEMKWVSAPVEYPSADYLEGDVTNAAGNIVARLKMGWVSPNYRKATVEIDTVQGLKADIPADSGIGHNWQTVFSSIGWELSKDVSDTNISERSGDSWSNAEMHETMIARRDSADLDSEWRYHILIVKRIDATERGIMYDSGSTDSNAVPREGVGISTNWQVPTTGSPNWGHAGGHRFADVKAAYFRTAIHELGHAFGLLHNTVDLGFMNTSDVIAGAGAGTFPDNIKWAFADNDLKRLRHYPDIFIRPGGIPFAEASETVPAISPTDTQISPPGLELAVEPLHSVIPLGAPVRVTVTLKNTGSTPVTTPADISLKSGFVSGTVKDSAGTVRTFTSLVYCVDASPMTELAADEVKTTSLTLLRGAEGALFYSGLCEITVKACWDVFVVEGKTTVLVTGPTTESHAKAARKILITPDAHMVLATGRDLSDGVSAINEAVEDDTLRPHFAAIEAKRLVQQNKVDQASNLVETEGVVMNVKEKEKLGALCKKKGGYSSGCAAVLGL